MVRLRTVEGEPGRSRRRGRLRQSRRDSL